MPPVGVGASRFASALETGEAKLWVLLIGVNDYRDSSLPPLHYAASDCQGIGEALKIATQAFPCKEFFIHHDRVAGVEAGGDGAAPMLSAVRSSLERIVASAQAQDTVLVYFSGHGVLEPTTGETILCLQDTQRWQLSATGLPLQNLLEMLGSCVAHKQLLWLDACHSGNISLAGTKGSDDDGDRPILNATPQVLQLLRQRAVNSRGFYALLSCDEGQQSWEFPDLGHGVFSYYLMRGLRGEAADRQGLIDADSLYRYIYRQTLQYIDRTNHQIRLVNQQKRNRGEKNLYPEYSPQTPKRIVAGIGEIILGVKPSQVPHCWQDRYALVVDGIGNRQIVDPICHVLQQEGQFQLEYIGFNDLQWSEASDRLQLFLQSHRGSNRQQIEPIQPIATRLLYLRGQTLNLGNGDANLIVNAKAKFSRSWLRQELRRAPHAQQTIVLDCPGAKDLAEWVEELKIAADRSQCIIACASLPGDPELFAQVMLEALISAPASTGLSIASLLARVQSNLEGLGVECHIWLSGTQGLIEVLPATISGVRAEMLPIEEMEPPTPPPAPEIPPAPPTTELPITVLSLESIPPAHLDRELERLLAPLVGPIAPTLLAQVTQGLQRYEPNTILERISPFLSPNALESFTRQLQQLFQPAPSEPIAEANPPLAIGTQRSIPPQASPIPPPPAATLDRGAIERKIKELVGPVGVILLQQLPDRVWHSDRALLEALSPYLTPNQCDLLAQQIATLVAPPATPSPSEPSGLLPTAQGRGVAELENTLPSGAIVDERFIQLCERELTHAIGPVAKFIVTSTQATHPHLSTWEFVAALISHIPEPQQAEQFRHRITTQRSFFR
jgi:uncharacterized caspase-like protein